MNSKRMATSQIAAAMATTDGAVDKPSRAQPGSMKNQVESLEVNECVSKAVLVEPGMCLSEYAKEAPAMRERLRNGLTSAVTRAKELTGGTYSIEVGNMVLGNRIYLIALVTRTA